MIREPLAIPLRQARPPLVLALDVGTSGLRAFVFDSRGRPISSCIAHSDRPVRTSRDGEASLDADERARATFGAIDAVLKAAGRRAGEIGAVATSTFWHSVVGVDARGRPTTPVLTWADTRPREAARGLREHLDEDVVHARTGCRLHASYLPAKLRWLREADAKAFARTARWLSFGEYLYLKVFGEARSGHGMASATGLYDQHQRRWDQPMLEATGIAESALAPISDEPQSGSRAPFRARWPALARVPWLPAVGDGACSNVGAGAVTRDRAALMLGTSGAIRVLYASDDAPVVRGGWTYRLDRRRVVAGGALSNGGNVHVWIRRTFPQIDFDALGKREVDEHQLTALPLLAGDRSPTWNDAARASVAGIGLTTSAEDIARAMLEGVAHRYARLWELVESAIPGVRTLIGTGGGALGHLWLLQMFADALGRPVVASGAGEGSARGAALLALERIGAITDIGAVRSPLGRTFRPRASAHARLRAGMERQRALEAALDSLAARSK